ncbi:MAG: hypothetical protein ACRDAX_09950 [Propionibacteriaceae bacterium]
MAVVVGAAVAVGALEAIPTESSIAEDAKIDISFFCIEIFVS